MSANLDRTLGHEEYKTIGLIAQRYVQLVHLARGRTYTDVQDGIVNTFFDEKFDLKKLLSMDERAFVITVSEMCRWPYGG